MIKRHKRAAIAIASVLVAALSASVVYAAASGADGDGLASGPASVGPAVTGSCKTVRTDFATHTDGKITSGTTFVDVAGATVTFRQAGRVASCVIVEFSSMAFTTGTPVMIVRAVLDGSILGAPADTQFSGDDDEDNDATWARTHAAQFAFASVAPGTHTIQIQFRSSNSSTVLLHRGLTSVAHA